MQSDANAALDTTFTQQRRALTRGATGNVITTYATHATLTGAISQPSAGHLQNYGYKIGDLAAWLVRLPVGTDIVETDRLVTSDGNTLEVQVLLAPKSYQINLMMLATEVK